MIARIFVPQIIYTKIEIENDFPTWLTVWCTLAVRKPLGSKPRHPWVAFYLKEIEPFFVVYCSYRNIHSTSTTTYIKLDGCGYGAMIHAFNGP